MLRPLPLLALAFLGFTSYNSRKTSSSIPVRSARSPFLETSKSTLDPSLTTIKQTLKPIIVNSRTNKKKKVVMMRSRLERSPTEQYKV